MIRATPADGQSAVRAGMAPTVVLTDIQMPGCDPRGGRKVRACFPAAT